MRRRPFQMSLRQRLILYLAFAATVASGATWAIIWHFLREDPEMAQPVENTLLKAHLAGALILLVAIGAALPMHASKSWTAKRNRVASALFIGTILGAVLTGYGILAFVWETRIMHFTHIGLGIAMSVLLPLHIYVGRYLEKKRIAAKREQI
jgi:cation transport ATPase